MHGMEEIYQQYSSSVYKYLLCVSGNTQIAEDLTQETFVIALKKIRQFRGECRLCQIAKHLWYQELKKNKKSVSVSLEELTENLKTENTVENLVVKNEQKLEFFKKLQELDELSKEVVYLRTMGNLSFIEIADILGKTANWARVTFFRAKQKIKEEKENG